MYTYIYIYYTHISPLPCGEFSLAEGETCTYLILYISVLIDQYVQNSLNNISQRRTFRLFHDLSLASLGHTG